MAVAMFMHWPGMTSDQYDAVMARLGLDANPAAGGVLHVASVTDEGLEVCDVWQTEQAFHGFLEQRWLPVVSTVVGRRAVEPLGEPERVPPAVLELVDEIAEPGGVDERPRAHPERHAHLHADDGTGSAYPSRASICSAGAGRPSR